jgi:hypothetical protein
MDELYDLESDPYEMRNAIGLADAAPALATMKLELQAVLRRAGPVSY